MKKFPIYILLALIGAFSVFSCVQPLDPNVKQGSGAYNLDLSVSCLAPATKAYENYPAGETDLNENKIDWVDWFIFRDTTAGNDQPWQSGRDTITGKKDGTSEFSVKTLDMQDYMGEQTSASGYVFTVANYPGQHSELSGTFHNILKVSYLTAELKSKLGINDRTKKFEELSNFVMTSTVESFTLNENAPSATVYAKLSRLMAKISINIHIATYIDEMLAYTSGLDTNSVSYIQTWYPDVKNIRAYLTYANMEGTLTPVTTQTDRESVAEYVEEKFFTYNSYGFKPEITYRNNDTKDTAYVVGTPFYSYPMRWETSDAHAPFIKIILAWKPVDESKIAGHVTRNVEHNFVNHTTGGVHPGTMDKVTVHSFPSATEVATGNQKFYYKITLPGENNFLRSNVWTKISLDVALLGGKEEETSVEVAGRYYVVNWSDPGVAAGGDLTAGKYLSLSTPRDTFYIYGQDAIEIPVLSSHNLTSSIVKREALINGNWTETSKTIRYNNRDYQVPLNLATRGNVDSNGRVSITFTDKLTTSIGTSLDCYPLRFTINIQHIAGSGGLTTVKTIYVIQYPPIYVESKTGGNAMVDGYYGNVNNRYKYRSGYPNGTLRSGASGTTDNYVSLPYGDITRYESSQTNLTAITVSAFGENSTYTLGGRSYSYLIADPRQASGYSSNSLIQYNDSNGSNVSWGDNASKIKVGNTSSSTPNYIAPKLFIASRWSRFASSNFVSFENAQKRCATYQEAGYPAGRWRLPTEAEVNFIINLQNYGFINELFIARAYTASGSTVQVSNGNITYNSSSSTAVCRCVYDAWYWGDDPVEGAVSTYTIKPE